MAGTIKGRKLKVKSIPPAATPGLVQITPLRKRFGLSQALLARLLDVSLRTVSGLESGSVDGAGVRRSLTQAHRMCSALAESMDPEYVGTWLNEPNEMLDGLKPVEATERGQIDLLWQLIEGLRSGSQL